MTPELVRQLEGDEGFRPRPYRDSRGKLTIGYGRNLDDTDLSIKEAQQMLYNDMMVAQEGVYRFLPWASKLDDARLGVLINMAFNMGIHSLLAFSKMLAAVEAGNYELAAAEMSDSKWAKQVGARAQRLISQMRTGIWYYSAVK